MAASSDPAEAARRGLYPPCVVTPAIPRGLFASCGNQRPTPFSDYEQLGHMRCCRNEVALAQCHGPRPAGVTRTYFQLECVPLATAFGWPGPCAGLEFWPSRTGPSSQNSQGQTHTSGGCAWPPDAFLRIVRCAACLEM
jgi:hypothetical protein